MEIDCTKKYAVEYRYYHQREYHNETKYFTNKSDMTRFIKNLGHEETFLRKYKITYELLK